MQDIIIQEYNDGDREECIMLLKKTFPRTSNESTFKWRFESSNKMKPILVCAKDGGKVISFNSWLPWEFIYNNKIYIGYQSGESATDITYRGRGIFSDVMKYADEIARKQDIDFYFGFPSAMSYGAALNIGYIPIAKFCFSLRLINPFIKKMEGNYESKYVKYYPKTIIQDDKITPIVTPEYCAWRFDENPRDYEHIEFIHDSSKADFYLFRRKWKGIPESILLDCQFTNLNEMFVKRAFNYLDARYTRDSVYVRTFFNENTDKGRTLKKYFPYKIESRYYTLDVHIISNRLAPEMLMNFNNWDIMPHCVDEL
jgi:hypothetical protein